ncbi:MAG: hypothetical protein MUE74_13785 [Bacteroidales bacterium]|jgi:hypothetical protein|nr:hypothetical protein [Bacteroidales bacterium]
MKKLSLTLFLSILIVFRLASQDFFWKASLFSFFDNLEFAGSEVKKSQTMAGVMAAPEIGLKWDSAHSIAGGVSIIHEFGSQDVFDKIYPIAYYQYNSLPFTFLMGAFPRTLAGENYPRMFFQDSVGYYRPNINGLFFQYHPRRGYVNAWLDWTGRQSETVREAFFIGICGRYWYRNLYASHHSYMFHYASRLDPVIHQPLHDNMLFLTSLGWDLSQSTSLTKLDLNAGWVLSLERERTGNAGWISGNGILVELCAEYNFAGILNTLYIGKEMMSFYGEHGNRLYWGDPVYRAGNHDRLDMYIKFLRRERTDIRLTWSVHVMEGLVYNEQMLKVSIDIQKPGRLKDGSKATIANHRVVPE